MVRRELGSDAAVLHTREVPAGRLWGRLFGGREIEVTASLGVNVPSRLNKGGSGGSTARGRATLMDKPTVPLDDKPTAVAEPVAWSPASFAASTSSTPMSDEVKGQLTSLETMLKELCQQTRRGHQRDLPEALFRLFTDLIESDVSEETARELVERVRMEAPDAELSDPVLLKARIVRMMEHEIRAVGPIAVTPQRRRLVALVGPTGVGKTTTIAKLAAHFRLKQKRNVGLITVDTYRIAAVEQLRTYADIIDLPMQVVSTPREMREAVKRMGAMDLILMDTAGRSPKDDIKIQELKAFLTEAAADEVHLVLSSVASSRTLQQTADRFTAIGATALVLTKLDEASSLGNLLPVLRSSRLPLSYMTNGQNVPDDIEVAKVDRIARLVLGMESACHVAR